MGLAVNEQMRKTEVNEDLKRLSKVSEKYALLIRLQRLTLNLWMLLFVVKVYKWFIRLKLKWLLEKTYRKYGNDVLFRNAMEGMLLQVYEEIKDSINEKKFIEFIASLGLTRKVKELLKEDAEEAVDTYKLKQECERNKERLEAAFLKLQEKLNGLSTV